MRPVLDNEPIDPVVEGSRDKGFVLISHPKMTVLRWSELLRVARRSNPAAKACSGLRQFLGALLELYGRDWPLSVVTLERDSQAVKFVQPNILDRSGLSVGENDGFADELRLHVAERSKDG